MLSLRRLGLRVLLTAAYVAAGKASLTLASVHASASPVWPPAGIALAAVLWWGPRVWLAIAAGAFIVNATTAGSLITSAGLATGNTLEALVGAWLITRFAKGSAAFERASNAFKFVLCGTAGAIVAATIGVLTLSAAGFAAWTHFWPIWLTWWLGDATGMVAITPVLLLWSLSPRAVWPAGQRVEMALLLATVAGVGGFVFALSTLPLAFLCIPVVVWAGFRFGPREASTVTLLLSLIAVWVTARGLGPFAATSMNQALLGVQALTVATAVVGLLVGAAAYELRLAEGTVRRLNEDLERRVDERTAELQAALDHQRATDARLLEAQEVARIGSWDWRLPEDVLWWSSGLGDILGIEAARASYAAFLDVIHPDDRRRVDEEIRNLRERDVPLEVEYRIVLLDGSQRVLVSRGRLIRAPNGTALRMLGTAQDITERKQLEEQLRQGQKMEAIGMLAGGIAHDFNNLLTAISGFTELVLAKLEEEDPRRDDLLEVHKAAQRAAALTRQLLAFSRRQILQPRVIDLNELVMGVQKLLQRAIGEDVKLVVDLAPGAQTVRADPSQLEQVMLNLAVNARDAMPHGGQLRFVTRTVHVGEDRARHYPDSIPGRYVRLTVSDSGVGIPRDVQPRIFEPFFTTKGQGKGTGLGLATVYGIVRQSGGFLDFASDEGHGTSFDIFIPAAEQAVERATSPEPDALVPRGTETILLAEDDGAVRRLAQQVLTQHGYTVLAARDGDEALVMAARHRSPLDLLITDLVMPGTSGRDLAIRLVANRPTLRILYISGYADQTALPAHGDVRAPLLSKPFPPIELLRKVREVLDGLHTD